MEHIITIHGEKRMKNKELLSNSLIKSGGYYKAPNRLYNMELSMGAIAVYNYLASGAEDFYPASRVIAKTLKISRTTVHKLLKELCNRNMIYCFEPGGKNRISKYEFKNIKDWKYKDPIKELKSESL